MGTNFYWITDDPDVKDEHIHIGKRSNAGPYCMECGISAYRHTKDVHSDAFEHVVHDTVCPSCGKPWGTTTSFTWTMMSHLRTVGAMYNRDVIEIGLGNEVAPCIIDEYDDLYTSVDFLNDVVRKCAIQFQSYGRW